jgi:aryl-alcohol dehydrogenase-like predicted oxidoreductase
MKRNRLADSSLEVSELCLGTMTWGEQTPEAEAHAQADCVVAAIDAVNARYPSPSAGL